MSDYDTLLDNVTVNNNRILQILDEQDQFNKFLKEDKYDLEYLDTEINELKKEIELLRKIKCPNNSESLLDSIIKTIIIILLSCILYNSNIVPLL